MYNYVLLLLLLLTILSCKKDEEEPSPFPKFTGITEIDINGHQTGRFEDKTDWQFEEDWSDVEINLFKHIPNLNAPCNTNPGSFLIRANPNPCKESFNLLCNGTFAYQLSIRAVDQQFNVIQSIDTTYNYGVAKDFTFNVQNNSKQMIRVYYVFVDHFNCVHKGHGDISVR